VASYGVSTNKNNSNITTQGKTKKKQRKIDQLMLFIFKYGFLKLSADLGTAFAAETRQVEGQWLEERENMVKFTCVSSRNTNTKCFE
jgi:hypothetical protein